MAGSAEAVRQTFYETHDPLQEEYAESLGPIKLMGALACEGEASVEYLEQKEVVFDDFAFAVAEMMATDPDFREVLDVDPPKRYQIAENKVRAANGEPMTDIVERGLKSSKKAAAKNPAMIFQVMRDEADKLNAERVDELPVGWTRFTPSMDPKEAFKEAPETAKRLGYEEGMMYWWRYSRTDADTMDTQARSVDMSDTNLWREVIKDFFDTDIPEGISANEWTRYGIEIACGAEEAEQLLQEMADEYYRRSGNTEPRYSATEFIQHNNARLRQIFEAYYPELTRAANSAENNETMQGFVAHILKTPVIGRLEHEARRRLMHIANSREFNDEYGRVINSILRYATVEGLRKDLPNFIKSKKDKTAYQPATLIRQLSHRASQQAHDTLWLMHERMAANFRSGVEARRSYGGCAGQIGFAADALEDILSQALNPQELYGRAANAEQQERHAMDESGKTNCVNCGKSVEMKRATEEEGYLKCTHCRYKVEVCTGKVINEGILHEDEKQQPKKLFDLARLISFAEPPGKTAEKIAA